MGKNITSVNWSATGLPAGVTLDAGTGTLSGTPTTAGNYTVPVTVTTNYGTDTEDVGINVAEEIGSIDKYTVAMLHFDDGNAPWKDECGNTWKTSGSPTVSETNARFGKALQLNGSSYLTVSGIPLGGKNFTIDFWLYLASAGNYGCVFYQSNGIYLQKRDGKWGIRKASGSAIAASVLLANNNAMDLGPHHIAWVYQHSSSTSKLYVDGVNQATMVYTLPQNTGTFNLAGIGGTYGITGAIDEFRISDGIARWTEDFTPPTGPYTVE